MTGRRMHTHGDTQAQEQQWPNTFCQRRGRRRCPRTFNSETETENKTKCGGGAAAVAVSIAFAASLSQSFSQPAVSNSISLSLSLCSNIAIALCSPLGLRCQFAGCRAALLASFAVASFCFALRRDAAWRCFCVRHFVGVTRATGPHS